MLAIDSFSCYLLSPIESTIGANIIEIDTVNKLVSTFKV